MADAVPGDTAPGDPLPSDIDPALFARLAADPPADRLGITVTLRPECARAVMPVGPHLLNAVVSNTHGTVAMAQDVHIQVAPALARVFRTDRPWVTA